MALWRVPSLGWEMLPLGLPAGGDGNAAEVGSASAHLALQLVQPPPRAP